MHPVFSRLRIGAYILAPYARTEAHVRDLADAGIDLLFATEYDKPLFDLLSKYGVGAMVTRVVPGWFGGTGDNAGTMREKRPIEVYAKRAEAFADHPAVWGIDVGDEPSSKDFLHLGQVIDAVQKAFPNRLAYLNLYPSYGMLASNSPEQTQRELGCDSYADYLQAYCKHVQTDYISLDHYPFSSDPDRFFADLEVVSHFCREYKRHLWIVLQVNSHDPACRMTLSQLRFQAYNALAYGAKCISWACYSAGWWHHQVLDDKGEKTEQYEKLKTVNQELRALASRYDDFQWRASTRVTDEPCELMEHSSFVRLSVSKGPFVTVGQMRNPLQEALFVASSSFDAGEDSVLQFQVRASSRVYMHLPTGERELIADTDGFFRVRIPSACGCMLLLRSPK